MLLPDLLPAARHYLLYAADVPVEASGGGSLLLYRLLLSYPPERLRILETNLFVSDPARRLPNVAYKGFSVARKRFLQTRLAGIYSVSDLDCLAALSPDY